MYLIIEGFGYDNEVFLKHSLEIRNQVLIEELGFDKHFDFDGKDFKAMHYILFRDEKPVGCARWTENEQIITIDRFAVIKDYRKKGYGLVLIKFILEDIKPSKKEIKVIAEENNFKFFILAGFSDNMKIEKSGSKELRVLNY